LLLGVKVTLMVQAVLLASIDEQVELKTAKGPVVE